MSAVQLPRPGEVVPTLQELCIRFLIEHIEQVSRLGDIPDSIADRIMRTVLIRGHVIKGERAEYKSLHHAPSITITEPVLRVFAHVPSATTLRLTAYADEVDNKWMGTIAQYKHLECLYLQDCHAVDATGWQFLTCLKKLQVLHLRGCYTFTRTSALAQCQALRVLDLGNTSCDDSCIKALWSLKQLQCLSLAGTEVRFKSTAVHTLLTDSPSPLTVLDLSETKVTPSEIDLVLRGCPRLCTLYLKRCSSIPPSVGTLIQRHNRERQGQLRTLSMHGGQDTWSSHDIATLFSCDVQSLDLSGNRHLDTSTLATGIASALQAQVPSGIPVAALNISSMTLDDHVAHSVLCMLPLQSLDISSTLMTTNAIVFLQHGQLCHSLQDLTFSLKSTRTYRQSDGADIKAIASLLSASKFPTLQRVTIAMPKTELCPCHQDHGHVRSNVVSDDDNDDDDGVGLPTQCTHTLHVLIRGLRTLLPHLSHINVCTRTT